MLIPCPECGREISDRAKACLDCGFPVAEHVEEQKALQEEQRDRASRERVGEADCFECEARGFVMLEAKSEEESSSFYWCESCKHTGRVLLYKSPKGYWAVTEAFAENFEAGEEPPETKAKFLGPEAPEGHRYDKAGPRHEGS